MRIIRRFARSAERSISRKRTRIGLAARIRVTTRERCGGAVVKHQRRQKDVRSASMRPRKMMRTREASRKIRRIRTSSSEISDVFAARKLGILSSSARGTPILRPRSSLRKILRGYSRSRTTEGFSLTRSCSLPTSSSGV